MYINFLTAEIGSRQKILGQEAMRPHLGNRPMGNVSAIGEAGTHCPITASEKYIKISKHDICLDVPTQQENNKNNKNKCLPFHNRFYLERINFYKACNRHELRKTKFMANYKQNSWKTKNLNFSWGQILAFFISYLQ